MNGRVNSRSSFPRAPCSSYIRKRKDEIVSRPNSSSFAAGLVLVVAILPLLALLPILTLLSILAILTVGIRIASVSAVSTTISAEGCVNIDASGLQCVKVILVAGV